MKNQPFTDPVLDKLDSINSKAYREYRRKNFPEKFNNAVTSSTVHGSDKPVSFLMGLHFQHDQTRFSRQPKNIETAGMSWRLDERDRLQIRSLKDRADFSGSYTGKQSVILTEPGVVRRNSNNRKPKKLVRDSPLELVNLHVQPQTATNKSRQMPYLAVKSDIQGRTTRTSQNEMKITISDL